MDKVATHHKSPLSHEEFKKEMNSALAEIEYAANEMSKLGSRRLSKLSNTFVLLTCLGFVPSAMANMEYLEEPKNVFILSMTLIAASSVYGIYYILQYYAVPELLRHFALRLVQSTDWDTDDHDERETEDQEWRRRQRRKGNPEDLKMALIHETRATAKEAYKTYRSLYQRHTYIDGTFQVIMGIISFALMAVILVGKKTDDFGLPALGELIFTVWIFFANILFALLYAILATRKRKMDVEAAEKVAEKVAKDWLCMHNNNNPSVPLSGNNLLGSNRQNHPHNTVFPGIDDVTT